MNNTKSTAAPGLFGSAFGDAIVAGDSPSNEKPESPKERITTESISDDEPEDDDDDIDSGTLVTAMTATSIDESVWLAAPAYPPLYLSTTSEYLPPAPKAKLQPGMHVEDPALDDEEKGKGPSWAFEGYENSLETDYVFDRFVKRVGYEGDQCLR